MVRVDEDTDEDEDESREENRLPQQRRRSHDDEKIYVCMYISVMAMAMMCRR